jgi:hypothetical protein
VLAGIGVFALCEALTGVETGGLSTIGCAAAAGAVQGALGYQLGTPASDRSLGGLLASAGIGAGLGAATAGPFEGLGALSARFAATRFAAEEAGTLAEARAGQTVFRVWGRDPGNPDLAASQSGPWGWSWTRIDPGSVAKYRDIAGLPDEANLGRFVSWGILRDTTGVEVREALPLGVNQGGVDELLIPNPELQIELKGVFGVNPPF